jgi:hypothetical protein
MLFLLSQLAASHGNADGDSLRSGEVAACGVENVPAGRQNENFLTSQNAPQQRSFAGRASLNGGPESYPDLLCRPERGRLRKVQIAMIIAICA